MSSILAVHLIFIDSEFYFQERKNSGFIPGDFYKSCRCVMKNDIKDLSQIIKEPVYRNDDRILILIHPERESQRDWEELLRVHLKLLERVLPDASIGIITKTNVFEVSEKFKNNLVLGYDKLITYVEDNLQIIRTKRQILAGLRETPGNSTQEELFIFLSFASLDTGYVKKFMDEILVRGLGLNSQNYIFFSDHPATGIGYGLNINDELINCLKKTTHFIHFISPHYYNSNYCLMELGAAYVLLAKDKILPLKIPVQKKLSARKKGGFNKESKFISLDNKLELIGITDFFKESFEKIGHTPPLPMLVEGIDNLLYHLAQPNLSGVKKTRSTIKSKRK